MYRADAALAAGMVNESCYDPSASQYAGRNLADSLSLSFSNTSTLADLVETAFARKAAAQSEIDRQRSGLYREWPGAQADGSHSTKHCR